MSSSFFRVLGVAPALGRSFGAAEERAGQDRVVLVSHAFWQTQLAADPQVINRTLTLNGTAHTVIGVMPRDFRFAGGEAQVWAPLAVTGQEARGVRNVNVIGRLRAGASLETGRAEMSAVSRRLESAYPESNRGIGSNVIRLKDELFDDTFRTASMICTVAVAFVLLIACANVANLMLVRASTREREIAVRNAPGADASVLPASCSLRACCSHCPAERSGWYSRYGA